MRSTFYSLGCVVLPALWGVAMHYVFALLLRRRGSGHNQPVASELRPDRTPIDYEI